MKSRRQFLIEGLGCAGAWLLAAPIARRIAHLSQEQGLPYLTRWRMLLAGQRLGESSATIAQIAGCVGYESESTFSRAFTREMGVAPGAWRRSKAG